MQLIRPRIKLMIWNARKKKKSIRTARRKKNKKMTVGLGAFGTTSNIPIFES